LELADIMASPANERPGSALDERIILRRLLVRGTTVVHFEARPRWGFGDGPEDIRTISKGAKFRFGAGQLAVWTSFSIRAEAEPVVADLSLAAGDELWARV
jgi:hypothetical protein